MKIDIITIILIIMAIILGYLSITENQDEITPTEPFIDYSDNFVETDIITGNPNWETCEKYNLTICQKRNENYDD